MTWTIRGTMDTADRRTFVVILAQSGYAVRELRSSTARPHVFTSQDEAERTALHAVMIEGVLEVAIAPSRLVANHIVGRRLGSTKSSATAARSVGRELGGCGSKPRKATTRA